jgi:GAF domain-containing protein
MTAMPGGRVAALEQENAELRRQLGEALDRQTATAEVLGVISASTFDLDAVLQMVASTAHRLCRADHTVLFRNEGGEYRWAAGHALAAGSEERERKVVIRPGQGTLIGRAVLEGRAVQIEDAWTDPLYEAKDDARAGGIRSLLGVPLLRDGEAIGAIGLARNRVEPYSETQIALVQTFAAQAVIAMENARLLNETRQRTAELQESLEYQTATSNVLQVISRSTFELQPVLDTLVETAARLCRADIAFIVRRAGEFYRCGASFATLPEWGALLRERSFAPGRGAITDRALLDRRIVHVPDIAADPEHRRPATVSVGGIRTGLSAPLLREGELIGAISLGRHRVEPFTERQIELVRTFADQAVIAMENARLLTETREALDQQTATAEVLQIINASPGRLEPVFDAILANAVRICDGAFGILALREGDGFRGVAVDGVGGEFAQTLSRLRNPPPGTGLDRLQQTARTIQITDCAAEPAYDPVRALNPEFARVRAALHVPMLKDGTLLGAILIYRDKVIVFDDREIALLENFAAQAVIAIENARLITETREALEQQTATAEVLGVINSSPGDLAPVFEAILEKAHSLCAVARGSLELYDGENFRAVAARGLPEKFAAELRQGYSATQNPATRPLIEGQPFTHIPDLTQHEFPFSPEGIDAVGPRTLLCVPLRRDGNLLGMIASARHEVRPFSDKQIALLQNFAAQAVIAMENARLITETREALEQQTATAEVLQVINSSPGDLMPVFEAILDKAHALCGAERGTLFLYDGEKMKAAVAHGYPADVVEHLRAGVEVPPHHAPLLSGNHVHIPDLTKDNNATGRIVSGRGEVRTNLLVPLFRNGALLGMISCNRTQVRPFSDKEIALIENFAAQAVIAMENARLLGETQEALEQQTATAEVLGVINSSPGDLAPVFDAILEKAMRLCGVEYGDLELYDGTNFRAVATYGLSDAFAEQVRRGYPGADNPATRPLIAGERLTHIADLSAADFSKVFKEDPVADEAHQTLLCVPLRRDGRLLGMIASARKEVRPFSDKEIALLENFAAQAVIAMENARLITETREALDQQTATAEVLQVINSSPGDLAPVFDAMLEKAMRLCGAAFGGFSAYDGEFFRTTASRGMPPALAEFFREPFRVGRGVATRRIADGEPVVQIADITTHESYPSAGLRALAELGGGRTVIWVALRKEETLLGIIAMYRQEVRPFTDKQIALLQNFAAQAVIAMENARLLGELRQRTDEVAALNRDLEARVAEQVEELGRVGRLKRFLAPQLAELIVSQGDENILEAHRREIVVVFCDLRGYTAFTETAEPEEVLDFLREYHGALGPLVAQFEGTLDQFSGDGIMVFFNDPVPCPDPAERAVGMAMAMREVAGKLIAAWRRRGRDLGFGAGIAQGYATLGQIGFAERSGYTAIGTVCNLAARLCAEAKDGQILLSQRVAAGLDGNIALEEIGPLALKGLTQPVVAFNVVEAGTAANRIRLV